MEPPSRRSRYSLDADVDVVLEGETVRVHSYTLMAASEVFAKMLQSGMQESESGRIVLKDKARKDFETLLQHIDLRFGALPPPITTENLRTLLSFAREYEITGLKCRCEKFLVPICKKDPLRALKVACEFDLDEAKVTATTNLLIKDKGAQLFSFEKDQTVRNTVWKELLKTLPKNGVAFSPKGKGCSSAWAVRVEAAAAMKQMKEPFRFGLDKKLRATCHCHTASEGASADSCSAVQPLTTARTRTWKLGGRRRGGRGRGGRGRGGRAGGGRPGGGRAGGGLSG